MPIYWTKIAILPIDLHQLVSNRKPKRISPHIYFDPYFKTDWRHNYAVTFSKYPQQSFHNLSRPHFLRGLFVAVVSCNIPYIHTNISWLSFNEGCDNFVSIDGIWKLRHPHCLYPVKAVVSGLPTINYPNVCTEEPETQASAFCAEHGELAKTQNVPTNLREFIHDYCRVSRTVDGITKFPFFIF